MKENNEIKSSAHSKYRCHYHIAFTPKYRKKKYMETLEEILGKYLENYAIKKE